MPERDRVIYRGFRVSVTQPMRRICVQDKLKRRQIFRRQGVQ